MTTVTYRHTFQYPTLNDSSFPALQIGIRIPGREESVDIDVYLDSGASESIFDGSYLAAIGGDLMAGEPKTFNATSGGSFQAMRHHIQMIHDQLGTFSLVVAFSLQPIRRSLLGRDFFSLAQIGFRENQLTFLVEPSP